MSDCEHTLPWARYAWGFFLATAMIAAPILTVISEGKTKLNEGTQPTPVHQFQKT